MSQGWRKHYCIRKKKKTSSGSLVKSSCRFTNRLPLTLMNGAFAKSAGHRLAKFCPAKTAFQLPQMRSMEMSVSKTNPMSSSVKSLHGMTFVMMHPRMIGIQNRRKRTLKPLHRTVALSADRDFEHTRISRTQRMSGKRAATAASRIHNQSRKWAVLLLPKWPPRREPLRYLRSTRFPPRLPLRLLH